MILPIEIINIILLFLIDKNNHIYLLTLNKHIYNYFKIYYIDSLLKVHINAIYKIVYRDKKYKAIAFKYYDNNNIIKDIILIKSTLCREIISEKDMDICAIEGHTTALYIYTNDTIEIFVINSYIKGLSNLIEIIPYVNNEIHIVHTYFMKMIVHELFSMYTEDSYGNITNDSHYIMECIKKDIINVKKIIDDNNLNNKC